MTAIPETMAAAIAWREGRAAREEWEARCRKCGGAGLTLWLGRYGEGGRYGPCPRCRVESARRFVRDHARQTFGLRAW